MTKNQATKFLRLLTKQTLARNTFDSIDNDGQGQINNFITMQN